MAPKSRSYQISALPVTVFAHVLVVAIMTLVLVWILKFGGGLTFSSSDSGKIFNWHPLLMVVGFILIGGEAIMVYKTVPAKREVQKATHLVLHLIALVAGILGICAAFKFQNEFGNPKLRTLHSWLGISAISLVGLQFILAFFSFVFPRSNTYARTSYLPWHVFFGMVIFLLSICTAETGIFETTGMDQGRAALIGKFTGLLIFLFAITVGLTTILPHS